jgi:hypothetical protein
MRGSVCAAAIAIIVTRAITHSVIVTLAACLVAGVLAGALLRLYTKRNL